MLWGGGSVRKDRGRQKEENKKQPNNEGNVTKGSDEVGKVFLNTFSTLPKKYSPKKVRPTALKLEQFCCSLIFFKQRGAMKEGRELGAIV